jgi:hypothetical protein
MVIVIFVAALVCMILVWKSTLKAMIRSLGGSDHKDQEKKDN